MLIQLYTHIGLLNSVESLYSANQGLANFRPIVLHKKGIRFDNRRMGFVHAKGANMTDATAALQAAFSFTRDDLTANQAGRFSEAQQTRLRTRIQRANRIAMVFVVGLAMIPLGGIIVYAPQTNWPMVGLSIFLLVLLPLLGYAIISGESARWQRDLGLNVAACVYGIATLDLNSGRKAAMLAIDGTMFALNAAQTAAIVPGTTYAVYYGPRSHQILSIEAITELR